MNDCTHPMEMVFHVSRGIYQCFNCGHTSHLKGKPYFCGRPGCEDVHTLTWEEKCAHVAEFHPTPQHEAA